MGKLNKFVLAGRIWTFLPSVLAQETLTIDQLKNYKTADVLSETIWEVNEQRMGAFILVVNKTGVALGDRVFPDTRSRSIAQVIEDMPGHVIAVGSALGERGWLVGFTLSEQ